MTQLKNKRSIRIHSSAKRALRQIEKANSFNMLRLPNQICFFLPFFNRKNGFFLENLTKLESLSSEQLISLRDQIPVAEKTCYSYDRTIKIINEKHEAQILKKLSLSQSRNLFQLFLINKSDWTTFNARHEVIIDQLTDYSQVGGLELRELFYLIRNYDQQLLEVKKMYNLLKYLKREVIRLIDIKKPFQ